MTPIEAYENYIEQAKKAFRVIRKAYADKPELYRSRIRQILDSVDGARKMACLLGGNPTELGIMTINFESWIDSEW